MDDLFKKLDIVPIDKEIYTKAFIHTSYGYENNLDYSYEKLEFLGDAIVDLVVSDYLYNNKDLDEGMMTKVRASYVCENALYEYSNELNLSKYLKLGKGELKSGGLRKKAILADLFEALMGAIYLDLGYEKAKEIALNIIVPYIENESILLFSDYKSKLQEVVQDVQKDLKYNLVSEEGPAHNREFKVNVSIDEIVYGEGVGSSKKEAEQEAAKNALKKFVKEK